jgi:hypothetical protein
MRNNNERLGAQMQKQDAAPFPELQQEKQTTPGLNFIVPTEFVPLPSRGKFYPEHHPLHGKDVIEVKQMTAKEEDILSSRSLLKKGVALDRLIQALVVDKNINTDTLTVEDRNAIIVAARISAYGPRYATSVSCPNCGERAKHVFDLLEKLEPEQKEDLNVQVDQNGLFTVVLPSTKWTVVCRALNGYDEKNLLRATEAKKKSDNDSLLLEQLKGMVVSIQGVEDKELINNAFNVLPAADSRYLRKVYQETVTGIDMRHTFSCKSCDTQTELEVPLTADFFWFK